jgi:amino acid adenylation domain-containing protein
MVYSTDLFEEATITRLLGHFQTLLEGIVADPEERLADLPLLSAVERHRLLVEWNDTQRNYPYDQCIHQLFGVQVERAPSSIAVVFEDKQLTYQELNSRSNQLAYYLQKLGVGPEVLVGICLEHSSEMVVGLLGILKAGGAYVPLDPTYPQERLHFMLEDAQVSVLLTQQQWAEYFGHRVKVVCLDRDWEVIACEEKENPVTKVSADNLAYVVYTSGSTGKPKGVAVPHRAVNRLVCNTNYVKLESADKVAQISNISFDAATFEIWGALLHGAQLVGISRDVALSPQDFGVQIRQQGISVLFLTTALFNQLASVAPWAFKLLRYLLFGGEAVDPRAVQEVLKQGPPGQLLHVYGPTESTTFASSYWVQDVREGATSIAIGCPIANTQIYVLDAHNQPVPIGVTGELYIGGDGLARGYINRTELTAERFIPNPFSNAPGARLYKTGDLARYLSDGKIEFLGRIDDQVKIRGFRIELGEISTVLGQHPAVRETVVMFREDVASDQRIVAYVVPRQEQVPTTSELRCFLKSKLPDYMVPSVVVIEALPLTPNGKVDRRALPPPGLDRAELAGVDQAPRTSVEEELVGIWTEILGLRVGVYDNFFELGGHSLLATQLLSRVRKTFGVEVPLRSLFETPTVEAIAKYIETVSWVTLVQTLESKMGEREEEEF